MLALAARLLPHALCASADGGAAPGVWYANSVLTCRAACLQCERMVTGDARAAAVPHPALAIHFMLPGIVALTFTQLFTPPLHYHFPMCAVATTALALSPHHWATWGPRPFGSCTGPIYLSVQPWSFSPCLLPRAPWPHPQLRCTPCCPACSRGLRRGAGHLAGLFCCHSPACPRPPTYGACRSCPRLTGSLPTAAKWQHSHP